MAKLKSFFIRSRSEGKTWKVYSYKPQGRPALVAACEGEVEKTGTEGVVFFRTILFGDRRHSTPVPNGRATKRALFLATQELLRQMADAGYIFADDVDHLISAVYVA
jgi:hypothetical protein